MKMLIIEGNDVATIANKFNTSSEATAITDTIEYGYTREPDNNNNIIFTLFYKA